MALIAQRGGVPLSDETELRVLLASLLRLENIGVLLGAGASVSAGGSTMKQLWSLDLLAMEAEAARPPPG